MPRVSHASAPPPGPLFNDLESPRARVALESRRTTERAARKASRRRAQPRWARDIGRTLAIALPLAGLAGIGLWAWASGEAAALGRAVRDRVYAVTAAHGLAVADVQVRGRHETDAADILAALRVERGSPILGFDAKEARDRLEDIPWVASARVERRLPGTITVTLTERSPMAIWQHEHRLALIDDHGTVLTERNLDHFPHLPMLVGDDAPAQGPALLALLAQVPSLRSRVDAAVLVGGRRWDLHLNNGVDVRLPEADPLAALRQLTDIEASDKVLERDIVAVDLRLPDRLIFQTPPAPAKTPPAKTPVAKPPTGKAPAAKAPAKPPPPPSPPPRKRGRPARGRSRRITVKGDDRHGIHRHRTIPAPAHGARRHHRSA